MKIEVQNIACGYGNRPIIENISFQIQSGDICCILGPNGVGKTTLFKTILKLIKPVSGRILINEDDIASWSAAKMAGYTAYVAQHHNPPFPYLVKDVVLLGRVNFTGYFGQPKERDIAIADQAMKDMGIDHLRDAVYTEISGGERQLVMIARALTQEPGLLVLDEPTASLDYGNMLRVMKKIKQLQESGYAVIMTTHNPDQAFMCDSKVLLLQRRAPTVFGNAYEVVTERNLQSAYGADVRVVEFPNRKGGITRMCAPEL